MHGSWCLGAWHGKSGDRHRVYPVPVVSSRGSSTGARSRGSWSVPAGGCPLGQGNCGPPCPLLPHRGPAPLSGFTCRALGSDPAPALRSGLGIPAGRGLLRYSDQTPLPGPGRSSRPGLTSRILRLPRGTPDRLHLLPSVSSLLPAPLGRPILPERIACSPCLSPVLPARCP